MRAVIAGAFVGVAMLAGVAAIQGTPDFSGRWVLVETEAPASIPRELVIRQTRPATTAAGGLLITQPDTVEVTRHFQTAVESSKYTVGTVGGSFAGLVRGGSPDQVRSTRVATKWEGEKLVIGTATFVGERSTGERYEMWSLTAEGTLSITIGEKTPAAPEIQPVTATYRRTTDQSTSGVIAGVVRDADGGGIPGARIHADMGTEVKTIVTDHLGRYRLDRLAPGTWRVRAELTGFLSATCAGVIVRGGLDTPCDLTLRVGMLAHSDYVLPAGGLPGAVRAADVIAHVRVIQPLRPATLEQGGVATEHRATVLAVIKGEAADLNTGREIRLWQRGAGDRFEDGYRINSQYPPFFAGEEVVGFFSRGRDGRIQSYLGDLLMFRIVDGKVASRDCCGRPWHGIENGTPLNELLAQLRKLAG